MNGYLALILTGHVPYVRSAGREPTGEDLLHETIADAIIPTLNALFDLREIGVRLAVALAYSPILLEQLADSVVQKHFVVWMERRLARLLDEAGRWEREGEPHRSYLARFYLDWGRSILDSFVDRYGRNLVAAMRDLCADGTAEPLSGAATHAYLPLLGRTESVRAQIDAGALAITRQLGYRPRGLWLPECGYTPALEALLRPSGTRYLVVDPSSLPSDAIPHLRPRWIAARRLAVLVRDAPAGREIMAPDLGYIGDPIYRSPRRDPRSGLALWRTGFGKIETLYDPYDAFRRAQEHAAHFSRFVAAELEAFRTRHDRPGIAVVPLDVELLGRGWFEGPAWLRALIEAFAERTTVALTTPSVYLRSFRPRHGATPRDGSWAAGGGHAAWGMPGAQPLWQALGEVEERVAVLVRRFPNASGERERVLAQAVRELLLAQSSDWPLLLGQRALEPAPGVAERRDAAHHEALRRPVEHLRRCERLCAMAEAPALNDEHLRFLDMVEELDNPFPKLNYRVFAN
jgi:1,4-alpha-glucan branching enzyme